MLAWTTVLCHSWLLGDGFPSTFMEHVAFRLTQDLYKFFQIAEHDPEIWRIEIHQIFFWKLSILVKIESEYADSGPRDSYTEIYVALVDHHSDLCVATASMGFGMKQLIVCRKGPNGLDGRTLWRSGFKLTVDSIVASLTASSTGNVQSRQIVCPKCLALSHPGNACTLCWARVQRAAKRATEESSTPEVTCVIPTWQPPPPVVAPSAVSLPSLLRCFAVWS
jgi:hypothetical protein